jgi:DNA-binding protein YbaB
MTDPFGDLETARATIATQLEQARERSVAMSVLAERVNATTATVRSPRGEVAVTATATAAITEVTLTDAASALRPEALAALLTATIGRAQRAAAEQAIAAAAETLGPENAVVAQLRADVESRFAPDDTTLR